MPNALTLKIMESYVGKGIGDICENGFASPDQNHCAHFVSHALGLKIGMLCGDMAFDTRKTGASIRCDELFNGLSKRGNWQDAPALTDGLLLFVTSATNVRANVMANVPRKHVGIIFGGNVYNFGNTEHRVRKEPTVESFRTRLGHAYHDPAIPLFFGVPE